MVGNHYGVEVKTIRYDAGYGSVLLGDGNNNFNALPPTQNDLYVPIDSRSVNFIQIRNEKALLITNNSESLSLFVTKVPNK